MKFQGQRTRAAILCLAILATCLCAALLIAQGAPGATITAVDAKTGMVTGKVNSTGQVFEFTLANKALTSRLHTGQGVYVNIGNRQVSLDGKTAAGNIVNILPMLGKPLTASSSSSASPSDAVIHAPVDLLTSSGTAAVLPLCGSATFSISCDANGNPVSSTVQITRNSVNIVHSESGYQLTANLSVVAPKDIPVLVHIGSSTGVCKISLPAGSLPFFFTSQLDLTSIGSGSYKVGFGYPSNSSQPWQVAPGTTCGSNLPPDWLFLTLASRLPRPACVTSNSSGTVVTQCPNSNSGSGTSTGSSSTGTTAQGGTAVSTYPVSLIMINEFGVYRDTATNATPSFLEVYNGSSENYDLKGHSLSIRLIGQSTDTLITTFSQSTRLPAHGYYVLKGQVPLGAAGLFVLRKGDPTSGTVLDAVAYGGASNPFFSTSAAGNPFSAGTHALARSPNGTNTNNNQADFRFTTMPTPGAANQ